MVICSLILSLPVSLSLSLSLKLIFSLSLIIDHTYARTLTHTNSVSNIKIERMNVSYKLTLHLWYYKLRLMNFTKYLIVRVRFNIIAG